MISSFRLRPVLFLLFFVSGACGLIYQVVWTRMAFASFGIITPVLSVVISVFMLGLGAGAWLGGRLADSPSMTARFSPVLMYAAVEVIIGLGAFTVPSLFKAGEGWLLNAGATNSFGYLLFSGAVLFATLLPWCLCMGATYPLMMSYVRSQEARSDESFSYLYVANVLGATIGALAAAVLLVEVFGFRDTLRVAASCNFLIALVAIWLSQNQVAAPRPSVRGPAVGVPAAGSATGVANTAVLALLFLTGAVSMAMEVVWTRAFAPVLKTQVYSFAMIVACYLAATFAGSIWYRWDYQRGKVLAAPVVLAWICVAALLPVLANDPRWLHIVTWDPRPHWPSVLLLLGSIAPFCAFLGYLTPSLIDGHSQGNPAVAGKSYAVNVAGCIVGPLLASYLLLPNLGEKHALLLLAAPLFVFLFARVKSLSYQFLSKLTPLAAALVGTALFWTQSFENQVRSQAQAFLVKRDYAASVVAAILNGQKHLMVNGVGMTKLTPITKCMAHLPLAFLTNPPQSALIVCFGMGTSHRSALSWGIETTSVELVPSVVDMFECYHRDAAEVLANPRSRIVIDDGRRFLARTRDQFDVIVVDPPPPVESAGSSLLYSKEFYEVARRRLRPAGILQAWVPEDVMNIEAAALRSLSEVFPHIRCFRSLEGWGLHMLASDSPIEGDVKTLFDRMPEGARKDLVEWDPDPQPLRYIQALVAREVSATILLERTPGVRITDDEAYNEYFLLREWRSGKGRTAGP